MLAYDEKSMFSLPPVSNHHTLAFVLAPTHISSTMASTFPAMFKRQLTNLKLEEFKSKHCAKLTSGATNRSTTGQLHLNLFFLHSMHLKMNKLTCPDNYWFQLKIQHQDKFSPG